MTIAITGGSFLILVKWDATASLLKEILMVLEQSKILHQNLGRAENSDIQRETT
jgi:hypothetical protein